MGWRGHFRIGSRYSEHNSIRYEIPFEIYLCLHDLFIYFPKVWSGILHCWTNSFKGIQRKCRFGLSKFSKEMQRQLMTPQSAHKYTITGKKNTCLVLLLLYKKNSVNFWLIVKKTFIFINVLILACVLSFQMLMNSNAQLYPIQNLVFQAQIWCPELKFILRSFNSWCSTKASSFQWLAPVISRTVLLIKNTSFLQGFYHYEKTPLQIRCY